ncbi:mucin-17-like [Branchiostoma floridae]|uniref:Mucin-17-like n=1 Tax=Branchiostoma floridae TaxID=7739 RepID=A0A9J7NDK7_BRAFL|nr:mucin-17-like [Branchiostoma floridae]
MAPFRQRMNGSYPFEDQIRCAGPANLAGQNISDVNPEDLICEETTPAYSTLTKKHVVDSTLNLSTFHQSAKLTTKVPTLPPTPSSMPTAGSNTGWSMFSTSTQSKSKVPTLSPTPTNTPTAGSNPGWSMFSTSTKSISKVPTLSPTPTNTPTAGSHSGWSMFSTSTKSISKVPTLSPTPTNTPTAGSNPGWSTITESNPGPNISAISLPMPVLATLFVVLGIFIISAIAFAVTQRCIYKRKEREHTYALASSAGPSNLNPTGKSSGHVQIRGHTNINSQSQMSHSGTGNSQHVYNVPTDDPVYDTIPEINQRESPNQGAGNIHLGSCNNGYEVPSPSMGPENGARPQARQGPQSHKYENRQVSTAARPNHYEPLRNPSGQQQHTYTSLLPQYLQHH